MSDSGKKYWYHFTFISHEGGVTSYDSGSMGFDKDYVTAKNIQWSKDQLRAKSSAIMINCSFLGRMTSEEFSS